MYILIWPSISKEWLSKPGVEVVEQKIDTLIVQICTFCLVDMAAEKRVWKGDLTDTEGRISSILKN